ncbi:unnamed protein product [Dovyalis caffra]|uniref:F-box domain-containing protein n=1 Tax=Dovyalis caffra TaxID=77055 RepID=A0AAV1R831_9ROSI|nr:unnamed protein product [Dovyalis caffra]
MNFVSKTDELQASSEGDSLQSLGITSGDLVYFSLNPKGFASSTAASSSSVKKTQIGETEIQGLGSLEGVGNDTGFYHELRFLKKVLKEELGDGICSKYNVLVVAVHAVFLESGLVGFDSELGLRNDRLYITEEGLSKAFTMSLSYTLPELLDSEDGADSTVLKFQSLGHFVNVYGALANGGSEFYWLCLDEYKIAPIINLLRLNCGDKDGWCRKKGLFDFLKIVKDELVLPLLADLCHKTGCVLQSCFTSLPADLKLKIFELLPGNDIARMEYVCSQMRQTLSSKNDLWKQKFVEEFWVGEGTKGIINWKKRTHELQASVEEDSLQSFGIASGGHVHFSLNPNDFGSPIAGFSSSGNSLDKPTSDQSLNSRETQVQVWSEIRVSDMIDTVMITQTGETGKPKELGSLEGVGNDSRFYNELCFLKRVLIEELGDNVCSEYNVLVVAVHAVLLESGLIGFDSKLRLRNDRLYIMEEGSCKAFTMSLCYTLPQLLDNEDVACWIVLKFQRIGHFVNVYGTLANGGSEFYRLSLDEYKIAPFINLLRLNCSEKDEWCSQKQFFEFQKIVKDELVLPISTDLCRKTGLLKMVSILIPKCGSPTLNSSYNVFRLLESQLTHLLAFSQKNPRPR